MGRADIVEAVAAASPDAMRRQRDASRADLVELRLDLLDRPDAEAALAGRSRPVIATCRASWEGGRFQGTAAERLAILTRALALGADYVDLEWKAAAALEQWPA
ncbi:MAG: type I 3-dehydroquinate dehydratase, partial [Vicinamibacteria bacterium]